MMLNLPKPIPTLRTNPLHLSTSLLRLPIRFLTRIRVTPPKLNLSTLDPNASASHHHCFAICWKAKATVALLAASLEFRKESNFPPG